MAQNVGKIFEIDWRSSIPSYCFVQRLYDPPQAFIQRSDTRFSHKNICDYIFFDTRNQLLYLCELKTTKYRKIAFEDITVENPVNKMIHKHQILGLYENAKYEYVVPCFILNFRTEETNIQRTYFIHINDFVKMIKTLNKKSFDEIDLINNGAIKINGLKKRTRYAWDINEFLSKYSLNFCNDN